MFSSLMSIVTFVATSIGVPYVVFTFTVYAVAGGTPSITATSESRKINQFDKSIITHKARDISIFIFIIQRKRFFSI